MSTVDRPSARPSEEDIALAAQQVAGLRKLADLIEENPELSDNFSYTLGDAGIYAHPRSDSVPAEFAEIARLARGHGAVTFKDVGEEQYNIVVDFGSVKVKLLAWRNQVCERVVVGTETVTKSVPDPDALAAVPQVEVTETVETVEWRCIPLLAAAEGASS